jgi:hypothetical protein
MSDSTCLNCGSSDMERPLLILQFQGKEFHICPQCMPRMIHEPYQLVDKIPGFTPPANSSPHDH